MRTVLVTGGAGYVGSHVCKALSQAGYAPVALDDLAHGHEMLAKWGALETGSLSDIDWVRGVIRRYGPQAVVHCGVYTGVTESLISPAVYYCNNVIGTLSLLNAMVAEGMRYLVISGSCAVYGDPPQLPVRERTSCQPVTPFGRSLWMIEQVAADYADAYGMRCAVLRCANVAGADPHAEAGDLYDAQTHIVPLAVRAAAEGKPLVLHGVDYPTPDGTAIRDYIHVSDAVDAHVLAIKYLEEGGESEVFNIGTGQGASVREVMEAVETVAGRRIRVEEAPRRPGDVAELTADPAHSRAVLHFVPTLSSLDMIVETAWRWYHSVGRW